MSRWIIHLKTGKTLTDVDAYPWDVPLDQITSVERVVDGRVYTICNHPSFFNFFVKTTESKSFSLFGRGTGPTKVDNRIVGCYVNTVEGPLRLELVIRPKGHVQLVATKVKEATKDGF